MFITDSAATACLDVDVPVMAVKTERPAALCLNDDITRSLETVQHQLVRTSMFPPFMSAKTENDQQHSVRTLKLRDGVLRRLSEYRK